MMSAMSPAIQFRPEHKRRIAIVIVLTVLVLWWWLKSIPDDYGVKRISTYNELSSKDKSLTMRNESFYLDGKPLRFYSGALHYFRVVPEYWDDRLQKLKASGLNNVETYVPWNWHEETQGMYEFTGILDIRKFIKKAGALGLHVIIRPGPYICSEWDFGGLPSWLLHDPMMVVRSTYQPFIDAWDNFFEKLMSQIHDLQRVNGGPIVAMQVENEYGSYGHDEEYIQALIAIMKKHGVKELLFTSDNRHGLEYGPSVDLLATANFKHMNPARENFRLLRARQPGWPLFVMEYWTGWFDHWGEDHHTETSEKFEETLLYILEAEASVNLYMFHGGTNFGFMNGANFQGDYAPTITSYDYDSPISEHGQATEKFHVLRKIMSEYNSPVLPAPLDVTTKSYGKVLVESVMIFDSILSYITPIQSNEVLPMEMLNINNNGGQGYGFIVYENTVPADARLLEISGYVRDRGLVMVEGYEVAVLDWTSSNHRVELQPNKECNLHIMVENLGRVNYGHEINNQRKGVLGTVSLDHHRMSRWKIYPLEFKKNYLLRLQDSTKWKPLDESVHGPTLYKGTFSITGKPEDTFLDTEGWKKGVVFINDFNIGRYWDVGPTRTMYIPAPVLKTGQNTIMIFELHGGSKNFIFVDQPDLG